MGLTFTSEGDDLWCAAPWVVFREHDRGVEFFGLEQDSWSCYDSLARAERALLMAREVRGDEPPWRIGRVVVGIKGAL